MKSKCYVISAAMFFAGCSTNTTPINIDPATQDTLVLCRALSSSDESYRIRVAEILVKRGASVEKCNRLMAADDAIVTGIAIAGAAAAAGAGGNNGGYYSPPVYGVAWDEFQNQYGQTIWRCRNRANGEFVYDYNCAGMPMNDFTWPGPYI